MPHPAIPDFPNLDPREYHYHETLNQNELIAAISQALDAVKIESVLWSEFLLSTWGVPTVVFNLEFVVPDDHIGLAKSTIAHAGLGTECTAGPDCKLLSHKVSIHHQLPPAHLHAYNGEGICLYKHSNTFLQLDSLEVNGARDIIHTTDPVLPEHGGRVNRGPGRWDPDEGLHPVRIPSAERLVETYILLLLRDEASYRHIHWNSMLCYMSGYVDADGFLDHEKLQPHHRRWFEETFKRRPTKSGREIFAELWSEHVKLNPGLPKEPKEWGADD